MVEAWVMIFFPLLMAFAACSDLLTMTISNRISVGLVLGFIPLALLLGMPLADVGLHLSCGAAVLALTFALFCTGQIGGGDAKLAAATAIWIGWDHLLEFALVASILGGLLTLGIIAARRWPLPPMFMRWAWIARLHDQKSGVPYGIALALAGLILYPETQVWIRAITT
jgi:prepilin peptidase CpaA